MNEPASFVNGAVPPGCMNATLNHPPYMPCKDPWPSLLAEPWLQGVTPAKAQQSGVYPDWSGHILLGALVFEVLKTSVLQALYSVGCVQVSRPLDKFLEFVQKTFNNGNVSKGVYS